jgi:hypothetical protein
LRFISNEADEIRSGRLGVNVFHMSGHVLEISELGTKLMVALEEWFT